MKSSTLLDSIVFQLTPTRTRCDLVITANGKSEKIASGLLKPFLTHLKAAEDQIGKGGYSIVLEPKKRRDATWFTKGTVERFVRFVSSPEILERVYTIESEILQLQKAISLQNSHDNGLHKVEDLPVKSKDRLEGSKPSPVCNDEKAIVLYQPASPPSEEDESIIQGKNSKFQLVQVLETRKSVLQKEQGMAFARADAASFDVDNIATLLAFAECFGASRMMDACKRFLDLWKAKHESGQWVEVEAAEAISCQSDMPSTNAAGIIFGPSESQQGELASEKSPSGTDHVPPNPQEFSPGQFPHPMFPPWQMHPQANGMPMFQPYPMQGMPYYQNYMGQGPYFQSPYTPRDDSKLNSGQKLRQRRHSMDSRDLTAELEDQELDGSGRTSDDATDEEDSSRKKLKTKGGKSSRKQHGTVVIRNINYITSAKQDSSDSDPQSCSEPGTDDEERNTKLGKTKILKKKGGYVNSKEETVSGQAGDNGNWQAFQNFLLNDAEENNNSAMSSMFAMEGKAHGRKRQSANGDDSAAFGMRKIGENPNAGMVENLDISGDATCMRKSTGDQMLSYGQDPHSRQRDSQRDLQLMETEGQKGAYRRSGDANMEYMINRRENLTDVWDPSLDPVIRTGFQGSTSDANNKGSPIGISDESFMVLQRSGLSDQVRGVGRTAMNMDCELPSATRADDHAFEPNDLNLMPNRVMEGSSGYDPAMDYEMQAQNNNLAKFMDKNKEVAVESKGGPRKMVKDQKLKAEKRTTVSTRRPSKLSPAEDARARAERLRAYKADLQKLKKEKEEEQIKRLEALKIERQKRIAAKSGAVPSQSPLPSQQAKRQVPKLSPVSQKGSKFSDTEPGSSSPLQRSKLKIISKASPDASKVSTSGRLNNASQTNVNRLTRSASSLRTLKEDKNSPTPDSVAATSKIRRLSEPKGSVHRNSLGKSGSAEAVSRHRVSARPEIKKMTTTSNMDKEKSSRFSEVKIRASKTSEVTIQRKSTKEMSQRAIDKILPSSQVGAIRDSAKISPGKDVDDNAIIEKTVVMLEFEKPSAPVFHDSDERRGDRTVHFPVQNQADKPEEDRAIPPPASPITVKEVDREKSNFIVKGETRTHLNETEKVMPNLPSVDSHKSYQAPYARVSSLEDPSMVESEYGKAPPTCVEMEAIVVHTPKVRVADTLKPGPANNDISEADSGKSHGKELSKGFKRLLIFGKKHSAASEHSSIESEKVTHNGSTFDHASNGSSSEVFTVKNLLTQDESSNSGSTKKSSRPFSLLSHFRSKNEKKKAT